REKQANFDKETDVQALDKATEAALEATASVARLEAGRLADGVRQAMLTIIKGVRQQLAGEQARARGPRLMDSDGWRPDEKQLLAHDRKKAITRDVLTALKIWEEELPVRTA